MKSLEHYLNQPAGQTYDKKSGRIDPKAMVFTIVTMANADYGTITDSIDKTAISFGCRDVRSFL